MPRTELIVVRSTPQTRLGRMWDAIRAYTIGPLTSRSPELARYFGGGPTWAGVSVNEETAMGLSAVWSAVTMISDDIASLPLHLYKRLDTGGKDRYESHPLYRLLHDAPNPEMTTMVWRRTMQAHLLIFQNAYAEIERDGAGRPVAIWPLVPERVAPFRDRGNVLKYRVNNPSGSEVTIDAADMIHLVGYSHDGGVGSSLVSKARESLALALATEQFGATFFGNGGTLTGVISNKGPRPSGLSERSKTESDEARHQGVRRAHKWLQLWNDASFTPISVAPDNAQFLETRTFQIREIARWFKMPPHKLGDLADATYSNVEQMDAAYLSSCIRPWLVLWQQELTRKLISRLERMQQFIEHDTHGFLSVDAAGRAALYSSEFNVGSITQNEIRGYENRDPVEGGDVTYVQAAMIPTSHITRYWDAQIKNMEATAEAALRPKDTVPAPPTEEQVNSFIAAMEARLAERDQTLQVEADKRAQAEAARVAAETAAAQARADAESLHAERDALAGAVSAKDAQIADLIDKHALALAEQTAEGDRRAVALAEERDAAVRDRNATRDTLNDTEVMLGVAEKQVREKDQALEEATQRVQTLTETVSEMTAQRDDLVTKLAAADAGLAELRTQLTAQREQAERLAAKQAELEAARVLAEARAAERDAAVTVAEAGRQDAVRSVEHATGRLEAITAAHRALIVDAVGRLLTRESERARKAQTTPERLREWAQTFYETHSDVCRSVFRPVVIAWAACAGVDAERALNDIVQDHVAQSRRELLIAAETDDADELASNVARVLRRWETERADAVADRLMAEGDRHGH